LKKAKPKKKKNDPTGGKTNEVEVVGGKEAISIDHYTPNGNL
jgi:hypothetical protein